MFDPGTTPYSLADGTGSILRNAVLQRAGGSYSTYYYALRIDGPHPLVSGVTITGSYRNGIYYSASASAIQLTNVNVDGCTSAVNVECSYTMCTTAPCYVRDSSFINYVTSFFCLMAGSFNGGSFNLSNTAFSSVTQYSTVNILENQCRCMYGNMNLCSES